MIDAIALSTPDLAMLAAVAFLAGIVRGFAGFALSALIMAAGVLILPPVELLAICWVCEMTASALMVRGGIAEADRTIALGLVGGSVVGVPLGLWATTSLPVATSTQLALLVIMGLAALQLAKVRFGFLATRPGLWGSGVIAGVATGIGSIGGMVVALYVLSQDKPARVMRTTLVVFLLVSSLATFVWYMTYGIMNAQSALRGAVLALPVAAGVLLGKALFSPRFEPYYRPACLCLLLGLALVSLIRSF